MTQRSPEREQFLADLLTTAIEHGGYGFPEALEYRWDCDPADTYALIRDRYEESDTTWRVDLDTMAKGLRLIREGDPPDPGSAFGRLLRADRTNGEDGDYDVIDALAVLEYALFGSVVYA